MSRLGLFVRYGVEVRVFLNEATRDQVKGAVLFHTVPESPYLKEYAQEYDVELVNVSSIVERLNRWGSLFNASRMARNRLTNRENFKHYSTARNERRISDRVKGNSASYRLLEWMHRRTYQQYINDGFVKTLSSMGITEIWFNGYSSAVNLSVAVTARKAGCRTMCYINSWKDYYINNYIPPFFDELRVWNSSMKNEYASANPYLKNDKIVVSGNPRLTALHKHEVIHDINFYRDKCGINSEYFILYTAVNPKVYDREPELVSMVLKRLNESFGKDSPGIVIKTNPMDSNPERWDELNRLPNIGVVKSDWEWHLKEDFNLPSLASDSEWFDLLYHCVCTMNVASTVTVESLVCGKPVINIGFDHNGIQSEIFNRYSEAPFYRPLLSRPDVKLVNDLSSLSDAYTRCLTGIAGEDLGRIIDLK